MCIHLNYGFTFPDDYYNMSYSRSRSPSVERKRRRVETDAKDGKEDEQPPPSKRRSRFDINANGREVGVFCYFIILNVEG